MNVQALQLSVDLLQLILWQYNDATKLQALLASKQTWLTANHEQFWDDWYTDVFDLTTANDFGLSVWGVILNYPLVLVPPPDPDKVSFGFGVEHEKFNQSNFANTGSGVFLTTEQKRLVLRLRYFQLVSRGTVPEVNAFLPQVFGAGAYVQDSQAMAICYVLPTPISSDLEAVLTGYDVLPRPAAVRSKFVIQGEAVGFGFGRYHVNFDNGNYSLV